ncbi:MAG: PAAR domain-containing protein [Desulfarculales bacterium]|jgi:uncharacterized Zn-binding protein involved in type VI secretion|nr:PAAR domain-containing protein [Desulfarculales bacterium]
MVWTIEGKGEVVRLDDPTTHGGKVITASANTFYEGIPIARVGDQVSCPKCKGTHTIITGAPTAFDYGAQIACDGDLVSCGAKLIARNRLGNIPGGSLVLPPDSQRYAEDFQIMWEGLPLTGIPYHILVEGGSGVSGNTDASGRTHLSLGKSKKKIELYLDRPVPPKIA